jgi:molybdopterin-guanine dinucleotide biosynthesis adapter protein
MRVIGLAGWSGAGKTTLVAKLIPELARRGLAVSTMKHAHHAFDIDQPGKDSYEHRRAGASEVLIASSARWALLHEVRGEPEPPLASPVDLVLVEGFKAYAHPKIEVHRAATGKPLLFREVPNVRAIAADIAVEAPLPVVDLNDIAAVADAALAAAEPIAEVLADLDAAPAGPRPAPARAAGRP